LRKIGCVRRHRISHYCCIGKDAFQDKAKASDRCRSVGRAIVLCRTARRRTGGHAVEGSQRPESRPGRDETAFTNGLGTTSRQAIQTLAMRQLPD
jgi:hypothetical protein